MSKPETTILCRKCGAEGTVRCSMPGCPLPPMEDQSRRSQTTVDRVSAALRKANYKTRFFGDRGAIGAFADGLRALCRETQGVPLPAMADLLEAQAELLRDAEVERTR